MRIENQRVPFRDQIVDWTETVTTGGATIHAAIRLARRLSVRHDLHILVPVPDPRRNLFLAGLLAWVAQKTVGVVHSRVAVTDIPTSLAHRYAPQSESFTASGVLLVYLTADATQVVPRIRNTPSCLSASAELITSSTNQLRVALSIWLTNCITGAAISDIASQ